VLVELSVVSVMAAYAAITNFLLNFSQGASLSSS